MAMKRTLLEMTQDILTSLDGDEVTAIADTSESASIASIIRQCFYEIAATYKLPEHYSIFELTETSAASPTIMTKPSDVISIEWIKYDNKLSTETPTDYREVAFVPFDIFQGRQLGMDSTATDIGRFNYTIGSDIFPFVHLTTRNPIFYTTYNDSTVVFDSYNLTEETFLAKAKTMCYGLKESSWTHTDAAVPNLDHKLSNTLFQIAKAQCFSELKQVENPGAEKKARRAVNTMIKEKYDINNKNRGAYYNPDFLPNYGRR